MFEKAPEREVPKEERRFFSFSLSFSSPVAVEGRRDVVMVEVGSGSIGVRFLSIAGRCLGEVDFDFFLSREKNEVDVELVVWLLLLLF